MRTITLEWDKGNYIKEMIHNHIHLEKEKKHNMIHYNKIQTVRLVVKRFLILCIYFVHVHTQHRTHYPIFEIHTLLLCVAFFTSIFVALASFLSLSVSRLSSLLFFRSFVYVFKLFWTNSFAAFACLIRLLLLLLTATNVRFSIFEFSRIITVVWCGCAIFKFKLNIVLLIVFKFFFFVRFYFPLI